MFVYKESLINALSVKQLLRCKIEEALVSTKLFTTPHSTHTASKRSECVLTAIFEKQSLPASSDAHHLLTMLCVLEVSPRNHSISRCARNRLIHALNGNATPVGQTHYLLYPQAIVSTVDPVSSSFRIESTFADANPKPIASQFKISWSFQRKSGAADEIWMIVVSSAKVPAPNYITNSLGSLNPVLYCELFHWADVTNSGNAIFTGTGRFSHFSGTSQSFSDLVIYVMPCFGYSTNTYKFAVTLQRVAASDLNMIFTPNADQDLSISTIANAGTTTINIGAIGGVGVAGTLPVTLGYTTETPLAVEVVNALPIDVSITNALVPTSVEWTVQQAPLWVSDYPGADIPPFPPAVEPISNAINNNYATTLAELHSTLQHAINGNTTEGIIPNVSAPTFRRQIAPAVNANPLALFHMAGLLVDGSKQAIDAKIDTCIKGLDKLTNTTTDTTTISSIKSNFSGVMKLKAQAMMHNSFIATLLFGETVEEMTSWFLDEAEMFALEACTTEELYADLTHRFTSTNAPDVRFATEKILQKRPSKKEKKGKQESDDKKKEKKDDKSQAQEKTEKGKDNKGGKEADAAEGKRRKKIKWDIPKNNGFAKLPREQHEDPCGTAEEFLVNAANSKDSTAMNTCIREVSGVVRQDRRLRSIDRVRKILTSTERICAYAINNCRSVAAFLRIIKNVLPDMFALWLKDGIESHDILCALTAVDWCDLDDKADRASAYFSCQYEDQEWSDVDDLITPVESGWKEAMCAKANKLMHALNGNTTQAQNVEVTKAMPNWEGENWLSCNLNVDHTAKPITGLITDVNRDRGFSTAAFARRGTAPEIYAGDLFAGAELYNGIVNDFSHSVLPRESAFLYRMMDNAAQPQVSPRRHRLIYVQSAYTVNIEMTRDTTLGGTIPTSKYIVSDLLKSAREARSRIRDMNTTDNGFYTVDMLTMLDAGTNLSDNFAYEFEKLVHLQYLLAPRSGPGNFMSMRGPCELATGWHYESGTDVEIRFGAVATNNEDCGWGTLNRELPWTIGTPAVPLVSFWTSAAAATAALNVAGRPYPQTQFIYVPPELIMNINDVQAKIYMCLLALMWMPGPYYPINWRINLNTSAGGGPFPAFVTPHIWATAMDGRIPLETVFILPVKGTNVPYPTSQASANNTASFRPSGLVAAKVDISWGAAGGQHNTINLYGWLDSIAPDLDAADIGLFLDRYSRILHAPDQLHVARERAMARTHRIAPLIATPLNHAAPYQVNPVLAGDAFCGSEADLTLQYINLAQGNCPTVPREVDYRYFCGSQLLANLLATGTYTVSTPTSYSQVALYSWDIQAYSYARMYCRRVATCMQYITDSLSLACMDYNAIAGNLANKEIREWFYTLFGTDTSSVVPGNLSISMLGDLLNSISLDLYKHGLGMDLASCNVFNYRLLGQIVFQSPYVAVAYAAAFPAAEFKPCFFQDIWMRVWMRANTKDYAEPPPLSEGGLKLVLGDHILPNDGQPTAITPAGWAAPIAMNTYGYLPTNSWLTPNTHIVASNRRAALYMWRHNIVDGQGAYSFVWGTLNGANDARYTPKGAVCAVGQSGIQAVIHFDDIPARYVPKLDVYPFVDLTDNIYVNLHPEPAHPSLLHQLSGTSTIRATRVVTIETGGEPVSIIPAHTIKKRPALTRKITTTPGSAAEDADLKD